MDQLKKCKGERRRGNKECRRACADEKGFCRGSFLGGARAYKSHARDANIETSREILEKVAHERDVGIHDCLSFVPFCPVFVLGSLPKYPLCLVHELSKFVDVRNLEKEYDFSRNRCWWLWSVRKECRDHPLQAMCV